MTPRGAPDVDDLYATPLDRFITERDRLVRELAAAGDAEGAKQVKALRKPSVTAWTLNQMAREEGDLLRDLIQTGERMRRALDDGDQSAAREAQAERRSNLKTAGDRARAILDAAGHGAASTVEKVRSILLQATTDAQIGNEILEGRLTREPAADALPDAFAEAFAVSDEGGDRPSSSRRVEKLERRVDELRAQAQEASERAAALARDAESARLAADAAQENAAAAERAADRAMKHLEGAEAELKEARR